MWAQDEASRKAELAQKRKALSGAQKRMEDLDKIIQRLYEDFVLGKLRRPSLSKAQHSMKRSKQRFNTLRFRWKGKLKMKPDRSPMWGVSFSLPTGIPTSKTLMPLR